MYNLHIVFFVVFIRTVLLLLTVSNQDSLFIPCIHLYLFIFFAFFIGTFVYLFTGLCSVVLTFDLYLVVHVSKGYLAFG